MKTLLTLLITTSLAVLLLLGLTELPPFGHADNPAHNAVMTRYLEEAAEETGAANVVTAMILDYRGFDTFFESIVIATSLLAVIPLFIREDSSDENTHQL